MVRKLRALAFLPPELVEEGFEELLAQYYDPIRLILEQIILESYRTNNHQEGNHYRLSCRITPQIAGNLWTFLKSLMKE